MSDVNPDPGAEGEQEEPVSPDVEPDDEAEEPELEK